jgi:hypothetical protein
VRRRRLHVMNPTRADLGEKSLPQHSTSFRRTPESSQRGKREKNWTPAFLPSPKRSRFGFAQAGAGVTGSRSRYFDAQGMIGTTLIAFAGEPSMTLELTAR